MTIVTDYNTLVSNKDTDGSIKSWVDHNSLPASLIVAEAEQFMWRRLRVRQQVTSTDGTIAKGSDTLPLPEDYIAPRLLQITHPDPGVLDHRLPEAVERRRAYDDQGDLIEGRPWWYYADADNFVFRVKTDKEYSYRLTYFHQPAPLSATNPTNYLTNRAFRGFLGALLSFSYEWFQDAELMNRWLQVAATEIEALNVESDFSTGTNLNAPSFADNPQYAD